MRVNNYQIYFFLFNVAKKTRIPDPNLLTGFYIFSLFCSTTRTNYQNHYYLLVI